MDQWYCKIAGREVGPLSAEQLRSMAARGQILPNDGIRHGTAGAWVLARQVGGLFAAAPAAATPTHPARPAEKNSVKNENFDPVSRMFAPEPANEAADEAAGVFSIDSEAAPPARGFQSRKALLDKPAVAPGRRKTPSWRAFDAGGSRSEKRP